MKIRDYDLKLSRVIILCFILIIVTTAIVKATTPFPFTINRGIYPGGPSYTVFENEGEYFAKNAYGVIAYTGNLADDVIEAASRDLASSGGTIYLSKGNYTVYASTAYSSGIELNATVNLIGESRESTILYLADNQHDNYYGVLRLYGNQKVESIIIDGNMDNQPAIDTTWRQNGIWTGNVFSWSNINSVTINNVIVQYCVQYGINLEAISNSTISNCISRYNGRRGIQIGGITGGYTAVNNLITGNHAYGNGWSGIVVADYCNHTIVTNNRADYNQQYGLHIEPNYGFETVVDGNSAAYNTLDGMTGGYLQGATVSNNIFKYNVRNGLTLVGGYRTVIVGNSMEYNQVYGFANNFTTYSSTSGNTISYNGQHGLVVSGGDLGGSITGNTITLNGQSTVNTYDGIRLQQHSNGNNCTYWTITANYVYGGTTITRVGIAESNSGQNYNIILGNIVRNCATANIDVNGANTIEEHNLP